MSNKGMNVEVPFQDYNMATPDQLAAIKRMEDNKPSSWIFEKIAKEVPQVVPDGTEVESWKYGSFRVMGLIDGKTPYLWNNVCEIDLDGRDLSKIGYVIFWRQTARKKNKPKNPIEGFMGLVPDNRIVERIVPGQTIEVKDYIPIGTSNEDIERIARESFLKLQEVVKEYYEAE